MLDALIQAPRMVIPLVVVAARQPTVVLPLVLLGAVVIVILRYLAWTRTTYAVNSGSLVVESGLLNRTRRVVPLDRVQQVDLQRKLRHRALGLAVVRIDTAGGGKGAEVVLDAVSEAEAARLRRLLDRQPLAPATASFDPAPEPWPTPTSTDPWAGPTAQGLREEEVEVLHIGVGRLALGGVTGSKLAVVLAALGFVYGLVDDLVGDVSRQLVELLAEGARPGAWALVLAGVAAVPVWLASAAGAAILTDAGFRLVRRGDLLHVRRGLLDQREATLAVHRVQVVRIRQNALRRALGLVSVTLQSAGGSGPVEGEDSRVTVPILRSRELGGLLAHVLPGAPPLPTLRPAPPAARRRAWVRRIVPAAIVALPLAVGLWPLGAGAVLLLPLAGVTAELAYRGLGWSTVADHVVARQGGVLRETTVVPVAKVQSTRLASSPFQRRAGLATLLVDVAGRGATPAIVDVDTRDAVDLRHRCLDTRAAHRDERTVRQRAAVAAVAVVAGPAGTAGATPG